ncbi:diguanylate cyclase [Roseinatronobacter alkalisoli]|uniref:diguanylate cyclase n=1 Tax=Roseinatronobacter alkalisoli TaxID=3028235 RepID=A0ABT5T4E1_9RHOB|nr:diguanylate cyclase [Roseinatronobacter sp. HJB301]MDD7969575.1 diguanylate cyclase [Roseinatronobacter sp. HJB301]
MSGLILIVDDLSINRTILRAKLQAACYDCLMADCGEQALLLAQDENPDLILLDYRLPDIDGIDICQRLRGNPATRDIPILLFSATADRQQRLTALRMGADDFLSKPLDESYLMGRIRSLLRTQDHRARHAMPVAMPAVTGMAEGAAAFTLQSRMMVICNGGAACDGFCNDLRGVMPEMTCTCLSLQQALRLDTGTAMPDLFLVSADVILQKGLQVIPDLLSRNQTRQAELCIILPEGQELLGAMALDLGAREVLHLPLDAEEANLRLAKILQQKQQRDALQQAFETQLDQAVRDPLTGLFNRRYLCAQMARIAADMQTGALSDCAVLVIDLDHFKSVNDRFGHNAGDDVLTEVARRLRAALRSSDILVRYGGEEFVVVMPGADVRAARRVAQRICRTVHSRGYDVRGSDAALQLSVSIGVAAEHAGFAGCGDFAKTIVGRADDALRAAKAGGRNRVVSGQNAAA